MKLQVLPNLQIGITDRCNLTCYMCRPSVLQDREACGVPLAGDMPRQVFEDILQNCQDQDFDNLMLCWVGEPLLHPDFLHFIETIRNFDRKRNFFRVLTFNTNGVLFDQQKIDRFMEIIRDWKKKVSVVFSLDAMSQETYLSIKKADHFKAAFDNAKYFLKRKAELAIGPRLHAAFQFLVLPENEQQVPDFYFHFRSYLEKLKQNWSLGFEINHSSDNSIIVREARLSPQEQSSRRFNSARDLLSRFPADRQFYPESYEILPDHEIVDLPFYKKVRTDLYLYRNRPPCISPFLYPTVHVDGSLTVCCRDNGLTLQLGNLSRDSFASLWHGEAAERLRMAHLESDPSGYPLCFFCDNFSTSFFRDESVESAFEKKFSYQSDPEKLTDSEYHLRLERVFELAPTLALALRLQEYYLSLHQEDRVEALYSHLLSRSSDQKAISILAGLRFKSGKYEETVTLLQQAGELSAEDVKILTESLTRLGRLKEACGIGEWFLENGSDSSLLMTLAEIYRQLGETDKLKLAWSELSMDETLPAELRESFKLRLQEYLSLQHQNLGNYAEALLHLKKLNKSDFQLRAADILEAAGKFYQAYRHLKKIQDPENFERRASLLLKSGRLEELIALYEGFGQAGEYGQIRPLLSALWLTGKIFVAARFLSSQPEFTDEDYCREAGGIFLKAGHFARARSCYLLLEKSRDLEKKREALNSQVFLYRSYGRKFSELCSGLRLLYLQPLDWNSIRTVLYSFSSIFMRKKLRHDS
ncbi:MAG: SPASM domain-containing protein [Candidatus Wallbacteria bacterium]|nr:SPASM domain-containing protein [Candidatus Wallbacteria bacterium]